MQKVYVLQAQGWGDNEDEFYNIGVYSDRIYAETAQRNAEVEWHADTDTWANLRIEEFELDA